MTIKERWELAEQSEVSIFGRLVLVLVGIGFMLKLITRLYAAAGTIEESTGMIILAIVCLFFVFILALFFVCIIIYFLGLLVFWIIGDYYYGWDDILETIPTAYKIFFGDYKDKYDFLKVYFK